MSERDIVERLGEAGRLFDDVSCDDINAGELFDKAAAEILRLRAELAARAVPDEEVVQVMVVGTWQAKMTAAETDMLVDFASLPKAYRDLWNRDMGRALSSLHAAGFTVIRTESDNG